MNNITNRFRYAVALTSIFAFAPACMDVGDDEGWVDEEGWADDEVYADHGQELSPGEFGGEDGSGEGWNDPHFDQPTGECVQEALGAWDKCKTFARNNSMAIAHCNAQYCAHLQMCQQISGDKDINKIQGAVPGCNPLP